MSVTRSATPASPPCNRTKLCSTTLFSLHDGGRTVVAASDTAGFSYPFWLSELFLTALDLEAVANGERASG